VVRLAAESCRLRERGGVEWRREQSQNTERQRANTKTTETLFGCRVNVDLEAALLSVCRLFFPSDSLRLCRECCLVDLSGKPGGLEAVGLSTQLLMQVRLA
jgi:hypothetical protein